MSVPRIGGMRARLTIEIPVDVTDDNGGVSRSYAATATVWGEIAPQRAQDRFVAARMEQSVTHVIRLRYRADLTGAMRLRTGTRVFVIHGVLDANERHRHSICQCEEVRP